jgi:hypothetical protein
MCVDEAMGSTFLFDTLVGVGSSNGSVLSHLRQPRTVTWTDVDSYVVEMKVPIVLEKKGGACGGSAAVLDGLAAAEDLAWVKLPYVISGVQVAMSTPRNWVCTSGSCFRNSISSEGSGYGLFVGELYSSSVPVCVEMK